MPVPPPAGPLIPGEHEITRLLEAWSQGDDDAFDSLVEVAYSDLSRIAHHHLQREQTGHTLDTQALVHEAYLHLVDRSGREWRNREQFYAVASRAMRRILVDYARRRKADKREGLRKRVSLSGAVGAEDRDFSELLALDDALTALAQRDLRLRQVVECRFFGGMTVEETAKALNVSKRSVERDWTRARTYLFLALGPEHADPPD